MKRILMVMLDELAPFPRIRRAARGTMPAWSVACCLVVLTSLAQTHARVVVASPTLSCGFAGPPIPRTSLPACLTRGLGGRMGTWGVIDVVQKSSPMRGRTPLKLKMTGDGDGENNQNTESDWRTFRAKLVAQEKKEKQDVGMNAVESAPNDEGSFDEWVYDAGDVIEQGSVILGGSEQDFGFGLRQQYFHKCVMLLVSHEKTFTRGIILNRPTSQTTEEGWRLWFGGDVQGLPSPESQREIICLHRLQGEDAKGVSKRIIDGIYWTSLDAAKELVKAGSAKKEDFWVCAGYAGWAPGQLQGEIDRGSWHVAAASSNVLLRELIEQSKNADTMEAGISVWGKLMQKIGRAKKEMETRGSFEDLMLKEWARVHLGEEKRESRDPIEELQRVVQQRIALAGSSGLAAGSLLRAKLPSQFVLSQQYLHKSVLLVLGDTPDATAALILNRPSTTSITFNDQAGEASAWKKRAVCFGGEYSVGRDNMGSLFWIHRSDALRKQGIGKPLSDACGICICSSIESKKAISSGAATCMDFLILNGFCLFPKGDVAMMETRRQSWRGINLPEGGLAAEIEAGKFEITQLSDSVWDMLLQLSAVDETSPQDASSLPVANASPAQLGVEIWNNCPPTRPIAQQEAGELQEHMVYQSNVPRSELADRSLAEWAKFFLGRS